MFKYFVSFAPLIV